MNLINSTQLISVFPKLIFFLSWQTSIPYFQYCRFVMNLNDAFHF